MNNYDEELDILDDGIRRLKIEYEIYFSGHRRKPPDDVRARVDKSAKRLADAVDMSMAQRFRYNTLIARLCVYRDRWRRTQQQRESSLENARETHSPTPHSRTESPGTGIQISIGDPDAESDKIHVLYEELLRIRGRNTKEPPGISFRQFTDYIVSQTRSIRNKNHCPSVIFRIAIEEDAIKFTAKPDTQKSS